MSEKNQNERKCFELTKNYIRTSINKNARHYANSLFPFSREDCTIVESDSPDLFAYVEGKIYGIEHFSIDYCNEGKDNNQSCSKLATVEINKIYNEYHDPQIGTINPSKHEDAIRDIQTLVNKKTELSNKFDYEKYVKRFYQVFQKHYNRLADYRKNKNFQSCEDAKLGFLVEFHCDTTCMNSIRNGYVVYHRGKNRLFPITKEIIQLFSGATDLDFIILSQFNEGFDNVVKAVRFFDPKNIEKSINEQRIDIDDVVFFDKIESDVVLKLEKGDADEG